MRRYVVLLVAVIMCSSASAYDISLKVVEELDSLDIGGVKVTMQMNDSTAAVSTVTDGYGIAELKNMAEGEYRLNLEKEGFYPIAALVNLKGNADLGTFAMTSTSTVRLDEVVVSGARATQELDKLTVRPLKSTIASSLNSLDVLRKMNLNGLSVNPISGVLNIYGKSAVLQVDGLERGLDYVMSIDPSRIEKIEYTNNPTARYMQSGVGGVINIILKKVKSGGSVYLRAESSPSAFSLDGNVMATYNYKDSEFTLSVSDDWNNIKKRVKQVTTTEIFKGDDGFYQERKSRSWTPQTGNSTSVAGNYQYNNSKGLMLNVWAQLSFDSDHAMKRSEISTDGSAPLAGRLWTKNKGFTPALAVYMRKAWTGKELEAKISGSLSGNESLRDNYEETEGEAYHTVRDMTGKTPTVSGEVRYMMNFLNNRGTWSVGIQERYSHVNNDYGIYGKDVWNNSRTYGYTSASLQFGKFALGANLGLSYTSNKSDYFSDRTWQPSAAIQLQYMPLQELMLYCMVNYEPQIPSISQRSKIEDPVQPGLVSSGNAYIKTEHLVFYWLNASYRKNNWHIDFNLMANQLMNPITNFVEYQGDGQFSFIPMNMSNSGMIMPGIGVGYDGLFGHLDISAQLDYSYNRINTGYGIRKASNWRPRVHLTAYWGDFYITGSWSGEQNWIHGFDRQRYMCQSDISFAYAIPHWKFSIGLSTIGYGGAGRHWRRQTVSPWYDSMSYTKTPYQGNQITIGVSYDLQFGRSYQRRGEGLSGAGKEETTVKILDAGAKL